MSAVKLATEFDYQIEMLLLQVVRKQGIKSQTDTSSKI
jgi:hypothetical protein